MSNSDTGNEVNGNSADPSLERLVNHQIVTIAVADCGGALRAVDTEDIAIRANSLAPGRFVWKKYPDQVNIEIIRAFLSDAKKPKNGSLVTGTGNEGWMLTPAGKAFTDAYSGKLEAAIAPHTPLSQQERKWRSRERQRLLESSAYAKFKSGDTESLGKRDAEQLFRVDSYVVGTARERKIDRILNLFGNDPELGGFVSLVHSQLISGESND